MSNSEFIDFESAYGFRISIREMVKLLVDLEMTPICCLSVSARERLIEIVSSESELRAWARTLAELTPEELAQFQFP